MEPVGVVLHKPRSGVRVWSASAAWQVRSSRRLAGCAVDPSLGNSGRENGLGHGRRAWLTVDLKCESCICLLDGASGRAPCFVSLQRRAPEDSVPGQQSRTHIRTRHSLTPVGRVKIKPVRSRVGRVHCHSQQDEQVTEAPSFARPRCRRRGLEAVRRRRPEPGRARRAVSRPSALPVHINLSKSLTRHAQLPQPTA